MKRTFLTTLLMVVVSLVWAQQKLELSQNTSNGNWTFTNGCSISNSSGKTCDNGQDGTIKYSAGVTYTISIPEGINIVRVVIEGYDNYDSVDSYLSLLGNTTYSATDYVFPQKDSNGKHTIKHTIDLATAASGTLPFKVDGRQVCCKITLYDYIEVPHENYTLSQDTYSGADWNFNNGFSISNNNGKTYQGGLNPTIKYSNGVQYTINIPDGIAIKSVSFSGYDNYDNNDAYIYELGGKTYTADAYVFPKKVDNAPINKVHTITLDDPATGTLTFTPKGQQVCWSITLYTYELTSGVSYITPTSQMEYLDRGLVVLPAKSGTGQFISWRQLGTENYKSTTFDLLRDGTVIASDISNATSYTDPQGSTSSRYQVVTKKNGTVVSTTDYVTSWGKEYLSLNLQRPSSSYTPNDMSVGDIDGDGQYELFVKWDPSNSKDNSQSGNTDNVFIDCYRLDGTYLWRVDLGVNIRAGAHYTQFMVYDFDGDGKAEMICKTAPGSKDGLGRYVSSVADDSSITSTDNTRDYRNSNGFILSGPEYLTVFDGATGAAKHTIYYNPNRGFTFNQAANYGSWGDNYGNRGDRFLAAVAYLNGPANNPSVIMCRGYYNRSYVWAVDYKGSKLTHKWLHASISNNTVEHYDANWTKTTKTYNSNTCGKGSLYTLFANGNHNISIGDVDGDGCDEIIWGSGALDHDGQLLYSVGFGHGDAIHLADLDPDRPGLELFDVHEENINPYGCDVHDAATGEILHNYTASSDTGRGMAADIDADNRGGEFWSAGGNEVRAIDGTTISDRRPSQCMRIYWDGDLQDELFDGHYNSSTGKCSPAIEKWSTSNKRANTYKSFTDIGNSQTCNTTKATPNLIADIFGDWREEIIMWDYSDGCTINIFSTNEPTDYRVPTLMHDHVYRMGIAWQNVSYNQPAHVGYYLPDYMEYLATTEPEETVSYETVNMQTDGYITYVVKNDIDWEKTLAQNNITNGINIHGYKVIQFTEKCGDEEGTTVLVEFGYDEQMKVREGSNLTNEQIMPLWSEKIIPAGTPIIMKGHAGDNLLVIASSDDETPTVKGNLLKPSYGDVQGSADKKLYVLQKTADWVETDPYNNYKFYRLGKLNGEWRVIPDGKAYLNSTDASEAIIYHLAESSNTSHPSNSMALFTIFSIQPEDTLNEDEEPKTKTVSGTITLPFYDGSTDFAVNYSDEIAGKVTATVTLGEALDCEEKRIVHEAQFNEISTTEKKATSANNANALAIKLCTQNADATFKPTKITFNSCKIGTDGGLFDLYLDNNTLYLCEAPNRNNAESGYYSSYEQTLSSTDETEHTFVFNIYGLDNKKLGLGNIIISGELTTIADDSKLIGDVNNDGLVNITDVVCLVNYILGNHSTEIVLEAADINDDGTINITDAVALVNLILG